MNRIRLQARGRRSVTSGRRCAQQGISLIEILVGMLIGLMVVLAAVASLIFIRTSAGTAEEAWRLQQDAGTLFRIVGWQLRQAGARPLVTGRGSGTVEFMANYTGYGNTENPIPLTGLDGSGNTSDTLRTSLQKDTAADSRDCLGMAPDDKTVDILNQFSLDSAGDLNCSGTSSTAALVSGVEDLQIWYGERTGSFLQYRGQPIAWLQVTSVMVCLRMVGERTGQATRSTTGCRGESIAADGRLRRTFFRVFQLRTARS